VLTAKKIPMHALEYSRSTRQRSLGKPIWQSMVTCGVGASNAESSDCDETPQGGNILFSSWAT
jgi:hypothetical protein